MTSITPTASSLYTYGERAFRLMALNGVVSDCFERMLLRVYQACHQGTCCPTLFDPSREASAMDSLQRLGGQLLSLDPEDGCARLEAIHLTVHALEEKLAALGASWERVKLEHSSMLAIIPPQEPSEKWYALQADLLRLKWRCQKIEWKGTATTVLVTCANADTVSEDGREFFVHHSSSSPTLAMLTRRIGLVLGWKRDIFLYNARGVGKSSGIPSEAGFYSDAKAVWKWVRSSGYDLSKTWFSSACAGGYRAGFLFAELPEVRESGVNWLWENGTVVAMRDWVGVQKPALARWFGKKWMPGLACRDIPPQLRLRETGFDLEALFPKEAKAKGRCIVIGPDQDTLFAKEPVKEFARQHFSTVQCFTFSSHIHDARFFHHPRAIVQIQTTLFQ